MENLELAQPVDNFFWAKKKVLVTGHTGFKGSWISVFLNSLGAEVHGFALEPKTYPNLYSYIGDGALSSDTTGDLSDTKLLNETITRVNPEIIFHLAAQASVLEGYRDPAGTWKTNLTGTLNLLQAVQTKETPTTLIVVTTDKVYRNYNSGISFTEEDALGGLDPYSASKSAVEILVESHRHLFKTLGNKIRIGTARAGNVIGGGDWLPDRIMTDVIRAIETDEALIVRNPNAIRPWQHVLDPISGYVTFAEKLYQSVGTELETAFNFANPSIQSVRVVDILDHISLKTNLRYEVHSDPSRPYEAELLSLNPSKAMSQLGWAPKLNLEETINLTLDWYRAKQESKDMLNFTLEQIQEFSRNGI